MLRIVNFIFSLAWLALAVTNSYGDGWLSVRSLATTCDILLFRFYYMRAMCGETVKTGSEKMSWCSIAAAIAAAIFITLFGTELYNGTLVIGFAVAATILLFFMFYLTSASHEGNDLS